MNKVTFRFQNRLFFTGIVLWIASMHLLLVIARLTTQTATSGAVYTLLGLESGLGIFFSWLAFRFYNAGITFDREYATMKGIWKTKRVPIQMVDHVGYYETGTLFSVNFALCLTDFSVIYAPYGDLFPWEPEARFENFKRWLAYLNETLETYKGNLGINPLL
jgi:hypothetical protein